MYLPTRTVGVETRIEPPADDPSEPSGDRALLRGTIASRIDEPEPDAPREERGRGASGRRSWRALDRNVYLLGLTSMVTDISSEMVAAVLPLYLASVLGFGPTQLGAFDGAYSGVAALTCVGAALLADRRQRHKRVAVVGYVTSSLAKLGLLAAGGRWIPTTAVVYADRLGKGIRTAPRDAILSLSSSPRRLAESFGVHRALDTAGAVIGPFVAAVILARDANAFDAVFAISFFVSLIGVGIIVTLVDDRRVRVPRSASSVDRHPAARPIAPVRTRWVRAATRSLRTNAGFRSLALATFVLGLATPGEALVFLAFQREAGFGLASYPLLFVGASVVFLVTAIPIGRLADRIGRRRVFIAGELALVGALVVLAHDARAPFAPVAILAFVGVHLAATDGVLMSLVASTVGPSMRTTGLAVVVTIGALTQIVASTLFGVVWSTTGVATAATTFAITLSVAAVIAAWILRTSPEPTGRPPIAVR